VVRQSVLPWLLRILQRERERARDATGVSRAVRVTIVGNTDQVGRNRAPLRDRGPSTTRTIVDRGNDRLAPREPE